MGVTMKKIQMKDWFSLFEELTYIIDISCEIGENDTAERYIRLRSKAMETDVVY